MIRKKIFQINTSFASVLDVSLVSVVHLMLDLTFAAASSLVAMYIP